MRGWHPVSGATPETGVDGGAIHPSLRLRERKAKVGREQNQVFFSDARLFTLFPVLHRVHVKSQSAWVTPGSPSCRGT